MNKLFIGAGVAALVAVPALALALGATPARGQREAPVTRAEVQARVQQRFAAVDADHDGVITRAELDASRDTMKREWQLDRAERRTRMFAMLDADRNGQISQQEFVAAHPGPVADMRGGGGRHRIGGRAMRGGMGGQWLDRLDADKDGRLTLAEATARPLAMFDRADANKDGTVTPEERRAARGAMRGWMARHG